MGQRLVIDINIGGERIANIYYHWSAYTLCTLEEIKEIIKCYNTNRLENLKNEYFMIEIAKALSENGGGFSEKTRKYLQEKTGISNIPLAENRNYGIIFMLEDEMEENLRYAEGTASIDFTLKKVCIDGVICCYDEDDFKEYLYGLDMNMELEEITKIDMDELFDSLPAIKSLSEIPFIEIEEIYNELSRVETDTDFHAFVLQDDAEGFYTIVA